MTTDGEKNDPSLNRRDLVTVIVLVIAAFVIRSIALGSESFWIDEVMTARRSGWGFMEVMRSIGERDHLPLYYVLMMGWGRLFGTSEVGLRSFSVLVGALSMIPMYLIGRRLSFRAGIIAGSIACVLPVQVYFGQEAKMYAMIILLASVSFLALLEHIDPKLIPSTKLSAGLLLVSNILLAYTHYYSYLFIICELLYFSYIIWKRSGWSGWKELVKKAWPTYLPILSGSIWFIFLVSEGFLFSQETGGGISLSIVSFLSIYPFLTGAYATPDSIVQLPMFLASLILFICMIWGSVVKVKNRTGPESSNRILSAIFMIILPLSALLISLQIMNIFGPRYFLILAPVVIFLAIRPIRNKRSMKIRNGLLGAVIILSIMALPVQYLKVEKDDWRSTISYLDKNKLDGDVIVPVPFWEYRSISYYDPDLHIIITSNATDLSEKIGDSDRVWVVVKDYKDDGWTMDHIESVMGAPSIEKEFHGLSLYLFER